MEKAVAKRSVQPAAKFAGMPVRPPASRPIPWWLPGTVGIVATSAAIALVVARERKRYARGVHPIADSEETRAAGENDPAAGMRICREIRES
jgi:hypothetical protein